MKDGEPIELPDMPDEAPHIEENQPMHIEMSGAIDGNTIHERADILVALSSVPGRSITSKSYCSSTHHQGA